MFLGVLIVVVSVELYPHRWVEVRGFRFLGFFAVEFDARGSLSLGVRCRPMKAFEVQRWQKETDLCSN